MIHGLALSGGGAKGAYEAAAASEIIKHYTDTNSPVTHISGASVGSLNAVAIAQGGPDFPISVWTTLTDASVYRSSKWMMPWRMWQYGALYDSSPLKELINKIIIPEAVRTSGYQLFIHTTSQSTGRSIIFREYSLDICQAVYASASLPGAFPPVEWHGHWLVDGGVVDNSPIRSLIDAGCEKITCIHMDDEEPKSPIQSGFAPVLNRTPMPSIGQTVARSIETMMSAHFQRDLKAVRMVNTMVESECAKTYHRNIDFQLFSPSKDLSGTLDFSHKRIMRDLDMGARECREWLILRRK